MLNLSMTRDKTGVWTLSFTQGNPPAPLFIVAPMVVYFHAALGSFTINKDSNNNGITINATPNNNTGTLQIEPGDTTALSLAPEGVAGMPCELTLNNGSEDYELDRGTLTITANVGTP